MDETLTILVVDDNDELLAVAREMLQALGHRAVTAASGARALRLLASAGRPIELLVSDVAMPGMDGLELVDRALERAPALPVLLVSSRGERPDLRRRLARGDIAFLPKPFTAAGLEAGLAEARERAARRGASAKSGAPAAAGASTVVGPRAVTEAPATAGISASVGPRAETEAPATASVSASAGPRAMIKTPATGGVSATAGTSAMTAAPARARARRRSPRALALAATVVMALGVGMLLRDPGPDAPRLPAEVPETVVRSAAVEPLAPLDRVAEVPAELRWRPVERARRYAVELLRTGDELVWRGETAGASIALPAEVRTALDRAVVYHWRVEALAGDGRRLARSEPARFVIAPRPPGEEP